MAKNELPKYEVNADEPGLHVPGHGIPIPPGTILTVEHDFPVRASLIPLNKAAEEAFDRRRKEVAEETEKVGKAAKWSPEKLKAAVDDAVAKVGPFPRRIKIAPKRKKFDPRIIDHSTSPRAGGAAQERSADEGRYPEGMRASDT